MPGALWEFRQNVRSPDHTGVQFVQSPSEPTTWQWEYVVSEDDMPLVDTYPRGLQPVDSYYDAILNVIFQNTSGATQTYNARAGVENTTFGMRTSIGFNPTLVRFCHVEYDPNAEAPLWVSIPPWFDFARGKSRVH